MANKPCRDGDIFNLYDGNNAKIYMVHKPGNGFGVTYTIVGSKTEPEKHYAPWYKFRKMIRKGSAT